MRPAARGPGLSGLAHTRSAPVAERRRRVVGSVSVASFLVVNAGLDVLSGIGVVPEHPGLRTRAVSDALDGPASGVAVASFLALAVGGALRARDCRTTGRRRGAWVLAGYAVGVALAGVTPPHAGLHAAGATVGFAAIPLAVAVGAGPARGRWLAAIGATFLTWPLPLPWWGFGYAERLSVAIETLWLLLAAGRPARR